MHDLMHELCINYALPKHSEIIRHVTNIKTKSVL